MPTARRQATPEQLKALPTQYRILKLTPDALATRDAGDDRIPIAISSEEPCDRWWGDEILGHAAGEIDTTYIDAGDGLPFCLEHNTDAQIGFVQDISRGKDGVLRGKVKFGSHPDAAWVQADMIAGIRKFISVGYCINAMQLTATNDDHDTYRVTSWTPLEASTVAVPADPSVGVGRSEGRASHPLSLTISATQPPQPGAQERSMPEPIQAPAQPTTEELRAAEQQRSSEILTLCSEHEQPIAVAQDFINRGLTRGQAAVEILTAQRSKIKTPASPANISVGAAREGERPFDSMGDFLITVARAAKNGGANVDPRLLSRAAGMSEGVPSDGGFAVPPEFSSEILKNTWQTGQVLSRVKRIPIGGNASGVKINVIKENARTNGSRYGGAQMVWAAESALLTASKLQFRQIELNLQKLIGAFYVTDELLQDAPALASVAQDAFTQELTFKLEDAIFNGGGAGSPLGILNSGAVVQVAIEAAETLANSPASLAINTAKMYARMPTALLPDSAWFINQDVLPYLVVMTLGGTAAAQPVFLPPGAIANAPFGSLYGRPIVPVEYAATIGTPGDIVFAALSQYLVADKGGPQTAQSMHVNFLTDETVFRLTYRVDGQPRWNTPITPAKGVNTQSPFITLGTRA
jgi:HK97 family phage major capsid protein